LISQESKIEAVAAAAPAALIGALLGVSNDDAASSNSQTLQQQTLCCNALKAIAHLKQGRVAIVDNAGVQALTSALATVPAAAAAALKAFVASIDGIGALQQSPVRVAAALVDTLSRPGTTLVACRDIASVLAGMSSTDVGVLYACGAQVPAAMVSLTQRMLRLKVGGGGSSTDVVLEVLSEACGCLQMICHHADGKVGGMFRLGEGLWLLQIQGTRSVLSRPQHDSICLIPPSTRNKCERLVASKVRGANLHRGILPCCTALPWLTASLRAHSPPVHLIPIHHTLVLAKVLKVQHASGTNTELQHMVASIMASVAIDPAGKVPVMVHAGASLVAVMKTADPDTAGAAAAALRCSLEAGDARRKLELLLTPAEASVLLGVLPDAPPSYRYVIQIPKE